MAKKSRPFNNKRRNILDSFRRVREHSDDRFGRSLANSMVSSNPVLIYDIGQFLEIVGEVMRAYHFGNNAPNHSYRQKNVIAICQAIERIGEVCSLVRMDDGTQGANFLSEEHKDSLCDAFCLLNGLERVDPSTARDRHDDQVDYVEDRKSDKIDLDDGDDDLVEDEDEVVEDDPPSEPEPENDTDEAADD